MSKQMPPKLTDEQRRAALEKAIKVRRARADLRKEIAAGKRTIKQVLDHMDDPVVAKMRVKALIKSFPGYGEVKTVKVMEKYKIAENRRVQGLGVRQVEGLLSELMDD